MVKQIAIIYAATHAFLDDLQVNECRTFEAGLYKYLDLNGQAWMDVLMEKKVLDEEVTKQLEDLLKGYKHQYMQEREAK